MSILRKIPGYIGLRRIYDNLLELNSLVERDTAINVERFRRELLADSQRQDPKRLNQHEASVFSQTGADGILAEIFRRLGEESRTFVEIGTEAGLETNTTWLLSQGWSGTWFDGGAEHLASIQRNFAQPLQEGRLVARQHFVTAENVQSLLTAADVPQNLDLLSLDIDRNTYWVLCAILYRPRVVVVEYNAVFPPQIDWKVDYSPDKVWNWTEHFGASLKAFERWGQETGYRLVGCDLAGVNAFFVRQDLAGSLFAEPATAEHFYEPRRFCFTLRYNRFRAAVGD